MKSSASNSSSHRPASGAAGSALPSWTATPQSWTSGPGPTPLPGGYHSPLREALQPHGARSATPSQGSQPQSAIPGWPALPTLQQNAWQTGLSAQDDLTRAVLPFAQPSSTGRSGTTGSWQTAAASFGTGSLPSLGPYSAMDAPMAPHAPSQVANPYAASSSHGAGSWPASAWQAGPPAPDDLMSAVSSYLNSGTATAGSGHWGAASYGTEARPSWGPYAESGGFLAQPAPAPIVIAQPQPPSSAGQGGSHPGGTWADHQMAMDTSTSGNFGYGSMGSHGRPTSASGSRFHADAIDPQAGFVDAELHPALKKRRWALENQDVLHTSIASDWAASTAGLSVPAHIQADLSQLSADMRDGRSAVRQLAASADTAEATVALLNSQLSNLDGRISNLDTGMAQMLELAADATKREQSARKHAREMSDLSAALDKI